MKNHTKSANRKALPKFLGLIILGAIIGAIFGTVSVLVGSSSLPEQFLTFTNQFLRAIAPYALIATALPLLLAALIQYRSAKKLFSVWDGENESVIDKAEEKLAFGLIFSGLVIVLAFFFFGIGMQLVKSGDTSKNFLLLGSFLISLAATMFLQQKIVDLTRQINPEKKASIYDPNFHKKWMDSCDENEQRQIGQAAYKAYLAVVNTCVVLWLILILLTYMFDIGVLPYLLIAVIFGVAQVVYGIESIRLGRRKA